MPGPRSDPAADALSVRVRALRATLLMIPLLQGGGIGGVIALARAERSAPSPTADRAAPDLRRPGGDRDRERPPVPGARGAEPRADRGARAADGDRRDPACHLQLPDGSPAGPGGGGRERGPSLRVERCHRVPRRRRRASPAAVHGAIGAVSQRDQSRVREPAAPSSSADDPRRGPGRGRRDGLPRAAAHQRRFGHRTMLATPLLREGMPIGAIAIRRLEVRPFTEGQMRLLETFAAQAVIAIENVRLFQELQARNRELTEALRAADGDQRDPPCHRELPDRSPAGPGCRSPRTPRRLCGARTGAIYRFEGELIHLAARPWHHGRTR